MQWVWLPQHHNKLSPIHPRSGSWVAPPTARPPATAPPPAQLCTPNTSKDPSVLLSKSIFCWGIRALGQPAGDPTVHRRRVGRIQHHGPGTKKPSLHHAALYRHNGPSGSEYKDVACTIRASLLLRVFSGRRRSRPYLLNPLPQPSPLDWRDLRGRSAVTTYYDRETETNEQMEKLKRVCLF